MTSSLIFSTSHEGYCQTQHTPLVNGAVQITRTWIYALHSQTSITDADGGGLKSQNLRWRGMTCQRSYNAFCLSCV
jgi:hypothetical protein